VNESAFLILFLVLFLLTLNCAELTDVDRVIRWKRRLRFVLDDDVADADADADADAEQEEAAVAAATEDIWTDLLCCGRRGWAAGEGWRAGGVEG
jgi:hypothetical protein